MRRLELLGVGCEEAWGASACAAAGFFVHLDRGDGASEECDFFVRLVIAGEFDQVVAFAL